jgi:methionyl-tRNA formyltransferase
MRLAVAATAPFGADVLERLAAEHDVIALLTRPDARQGRGRKLAPSPAKDVAISHGIDVLEPARLSGDLELDTDAVVVCAYGLLIPESLLERSLWVYVHPSLLPRWRGAAPVERAIMAGDEETGVTIHRTIKELDAGPIAAQQAFSIGLDDDAGVVFARAAEIAVELLRTVLPSPHFVAQPDAGVTYADKIAASDRELDWNRPPRELHDRVRALSPHIGARGILGGRRVLVWRTRVHDGRLELLEVQPEGKRRMTYEEFRRGLR